MDLLIFEKRRLLRYNLLFQLYRDFFTYGYEVCSNIDYEIPNDCRIEIIAALYFIYYRRWIFFNIERDKTVSAYVLGRGMEEVENYLIETGKFAVSNIFEDLLIPVINKEEKSGGTVNADYNGAFI
ncbi:hypothetical protein LGL55_09330 [Clostridium tagluense]|uniref:Uncharacterized protein n=1 Tax=Clostridium tagluense TaxID=360422 RepID=A0A401USX9_9CLOT|nr:hypothetical protein [Clostridium tagluense]MCB2311452.1 hypothetical protein [Clostridium tagluense]MCB2316176.1 hypothetical protein [Clostridium tagluense]MCB2321020.1 hypothetical protein [Clostridium tagluense]MCB2326037.1 hypothetical protein [Clostridium tagluense]MCB2330760.1 hypothetical protein [Clostridium tagluense]